MAASEWRAWRFGSQRARARTDGKGWEFQPNTEGLTGPLDGCWLPGVSRADGGAWMLAFGPGGTG